MPIKKIDPFLETAILSLKNQVFDKFTCLILTGQLDVSDLNKIKASISDDSRFEIHQLRLDGIAFALNYGINLSKTKYIARMDGDDFSYPLRFEKQVQFLERNTNYVAVGCRVELIDQNGRRMSKSFKFYENDSEIRKALKYRMPLCHPAIIFRTSALISNKGYMYGNNAEDHELYLRIVRDKEHLFKNLPDLLFSYRRHDDQLTNIKNARLAYCNIGGFMFTEFLLSGNPIYLVGIFANHPILRKIRNIWSTVRSIL